MPRTPEKTPLWGDALCLDFANTVDWSGDEHFEPFETDVLRTGEMLGSWGRRLGLLADDAAPASAAELRRSRALRDALHHVFAERGASGLDVLMTTYAEAVRHATLT